MRLSPHVAALAVLLAGILLPEAAARAETLRFGARLSGMFEPGGDSDGFGSFLMEVDSQTGRACYTLMTRQIGIATSAGIHSRKAGWTFGPPTLPLDVTGPLNDTCTTLPPEALGAIAASPVSFQVSVRNDQFPRGALRGQLERR